MKMTRQEAYNQLLHRFQAPENTSKRIEAEKDTGLGIVWHLKRAKTMLESIPTATGNEKVIFENTFAVSIRDVRRMMDDQGWI